MKTCPRCDDETAKVIAWGLPLRLCLKCNMVGGAWAMVYDALAVFETEGFSFMVYRGSYWRALWHWLRGRDALGGG